MLWRMPPPGKRNLPRLLIVDDDPVSLHFLAEVARGSHCDVVAVPNAAAALAAAHASPLDLLLLDRRLPDMSGAELLARPEVKAAYLEGGRQRAKA